MANFGIANILEVTTESAVTGQRTRCVARRDELQVQPGLHRRRGSCRRPDEVGTEIVGEVAPGTSLDVNSVKAYVSDFVAFLQTSVTFNGDLVSRQPIEKAVPVGCCRVVDRSQKLSRFEPEAVRPMSACGSRSMAISASTSRSL
jgi:molecular chaperone HtpG